MSMHKATLLATVMALGAMGRGVPLPELRGRKPFPGPRIQPPVRRVKNPNSHIAHLVGANCSAGEKMRGVDAS